MKKRENKIERFHRKTGTQATAAFGWAVRRSQGRLWLACGAVAATGHGEATPAAGTRHGCRWEALWGHISCQIAFYAVLRGQFHLPLLSKDKRGSGWGLLGGLHLGEETWIYDLPPGDLGQVT